MVISWRLQNHHSKRNGKRFVFFFTRLAWKLFSELFKIINIDYFVSLHTDVDFQCEWSSCAVNVNIHINIAGFNASFHVCLAETSKIDRKTAKWNLATGHFSSTYRQWCPSAECQWYWPIAAFVPVESKSIRWFPAIIPGHFTINDKFKCNWESRSSIRNWFHSLFSNSRPSGEQFGQKQSKQSRKCDASWTITTTNERFESEREYEFKLAFSVGRSQHIERFLSMCRSTAWSTNSRS